MYTHLQNPPVNSQEFKSEEIRIKNSMRISQPTRDNDNTIDSFWSEAQPARLIVFEKR